MQFPLGQTGNPQEKPVTFPSAPSVDGSEGG